MKRREFIKELERAGCRLHRSGGRHDIFLNPTNGRKAPVSRHQEIKNTLCDLVRKQLGLK